jgi:hypothetical protein
MSYQYLVGAEIDYKDDPAQFDQEPTRPAPAACGSSSRKNHEKKPPQGGFFHGLFWRSGRAATSTGAGWSRWPDCRLAVPSGEMPAARAAPILRCKAVSV